MSKSDYEHIKALERHLAYFAWIFPYGDDLFNKGMNHLFDYHNTKKKKKIKAIFIIMGLRFKGETYSLSLFAEMYTFIRVFS